MKFEILVRIPSYGPQTDQSHGENIQYYIILKHANVTTPLRFYLTFVFLEIKRVFFGNRLRELVSLVEQIICDRFAKNEPINKNWVAFFILFFLNIPNNPNHVTN